MIFVISTETCVTVSVHENRSEKNDLNPENGDNTLEVFYLNRHPFRSESMSPCGDFPCRVRSKDQTLRL